MDSENVELGLLSARSFLNERDAATLDAVIDERGPPPRWRSLLVQAGPFLLLGMFAWAALAFDQRHAATGTTAQERSMSTLLVAAESPAEAANKCHTAAPGEKCYGKVVWAFTTGIEKHPEYYRGLSEESTFTDFQAHFYKSKYGNCSMPCDGPGPSRKSLMPDTCLCLFDVDRTLTGKQGMAGKCPGTQLHAGVQDTAFGGGELVLSPLGVGVKNTFCGKCHLGIVSAGAAGGPGEKAVLQESLASGGCGTVWSTPGAINSPLVMGCPDAQKAKCAKGIVDWFKKAKHIDIPAEEVYFFDDHTGNTNGFDAFGFNARQVSCPSREGVIGLCGAQLNEIVREKGVTNC